MVPNINIIRAIDILNDATQLDSLSITTTITMSITIGVPTDIVG